MLYHETLQSLHNFVETLGGFFFIIFSYLLQIFIAQICLLSEHFLNFNVLIVLQQEISKPNYEDVKNFSSVKSFLLLVLKLPPDILCCAVLATSNNHSLFPLSITTLILQTSVLTVPIWFFFLSGTCQFALPFCIPLSQPRDRPKARMRQLNKASAGLTFFSQVLSKLWT